MPRANAGWFVSTGVVGWTDGSDGEMFVEPLGCSCNNNIIKIVNKKMLNYNKI